MGGGETYILVQLVNRHETEDTDCFKRPVGAVIQYSREEISPTLRREMHHHEPIVVIENGKETDNHDREKVL